MSRCARTNQGTPLKKAQPSAKTTFDRDRRQNRMLLSAAKHFAVGRDGMRWWTARAHVQGQGSKVMDHWWWWRHTYLIEQQECVVLGNNVQHNVGWTQDEKILHHGGIATQSRGCKAHHLHWMNATKTAASLNSLVGPFMCSHFSLGDSRMWLIAIWHIVSCCLLIPITTIVSLDGPRFCPESASGSHISQLSRGYDRQATFGVKTQARLSCKGQTTLHDGRTPVCRAHRSHYMIDIHGVNQPTKGQWPYLSSL